MLERRRLKGSVEECGKNTIPRGILLTAIKLKHYGQSSAQRRVSAELSLQTAASRRRDIEQSVRTKGEEGFTFDGIDYTDFGVKAFKLEARYDANTGRADLEVYSDKTAGTVLHGSIEQVTSVLEFISPLFDLPVAPSDKVVLVFRDDNVLLQSEIDQLNELADFKADPDGWSPESPEQCSDAESEVYFPYDRKIR